MRPEIKRMNERLGYFLTQMDLANAQVDHAEREIERLEKELHDTKGENGLLFARNIELERATREFPCDARISELNAEIQELKKNLDFFKKEAAKLEGLYWELDELRSDSEEQSRIIKDLGEKNFLLNQTLNAENDRLERNEELSKENTGLRAALLGMERLLAEQAIELNRVEGTHYCQGKNCGATAYIYHMLNGGKYYCGHCFKKEVIKL